MAGKKVRTWKRSGRIDFRKKQVQSKPKTVKTVKKKKRLQ